MLGLVKGKIGDIVGYRVTNSNDKVKQGWRPYRAHISNPKSFLQASQRVKINNITRNYGQLKEVISRGFEGIKYGGMSYQEFLRINMLNAPEGPWVEKNYVTAVPGEYQISRGSLPTINMRASGAESFTSNLASSPAESGNSVTLAAFSTKIITANPWLQDGDQLTWIAVFEYEGGAFDYRVASVNLDTTNITKSFPVTQKGQIDIGSTILVDNDNNYIIDADSGLEDEELMAAACVLSRDGGDEHLRSSEKLALIFEKSSYVEENFFSAAAKRAAILSFMAEGSDIDWPVEQIPGTTSLQATRSAVPAPAVEPDNKTTKKKSSKE